MATSAQTLQQIEALKAKQLAGTITKEELELLSQLEAEVAAAEQPLAEDTLNEISSESASAESTLSIPDVGIALPAAGAGLALAAGGGGGGSGGAVVQQLGSSFGGQLVNGYIKNARVYQDNNNNGSYDEGEPFAVTDSLGRFELEGFIANGGPTVADPTWTNQTGESQVAIDRTTGANVSTVFSAPAGSKIISPLSTLLAAGATQDQIKQAFNIDDALAFDSSFSQCFD